MTIMYKELNEAPSVVKNAINQNIEVSKTVKKAVEAKGLKRVIIAARGSSLHAGIAFKFFLETNTPLSVAFEYPSIATLFKAKRDMSDTLYVVISQSGAGPDTINMTNYALDAGATVLAVTNDINSAVAKLANYNLAVAAGPELAVAATKTLTGEIIALEVLSLILGGKTINVTFAQDALKSILANEIAKMPEELVNASAVIALSRGYTEVVAKECSLKLMETCYLFTFASSTNEFQHGPKALVNQGTPVLLFAPSGRCKDDYVKVAKDLSEKGAFLVIFSDMDDLKQYSKLFIKMPTVTEEETSVCYLVKMQQFVEKLCVSKGLSPDTPRNLNKITITK